jgi:uncharacterized protein (DUF2126 family)/transglutaminase-like putative cysteine protease
MAIRVALSHETSYSYDRAVTLFPHVVRLRPAPHCRTPIVSYSLRVEPEGHFLNWQQDPYSNYLGRLVFPKEAHKFSVKVDLIAELGPINPFDFFVEDAAKKFPFQYSEVLSKELLPYLETLPGGPLFQALVKEAKRQDIVTVDYLVELNQIINSKLKYSIRLEPGVRTPEETLTEQGGSCRDFAWLLVQLCRHVGLAARFVSGYSIQLVADEKPLDDGPAGVSQDICDLHAWTEVYIPGAGWVGLDATCGLLTGEGYIPLACTADPQTAAPITGGFGWTKNDEDEDDELQEDFQFAMSVKRIHETPRVTKPYSREQWEAINALGRYIDADLREWDVRLTMGGEPTFVSIDNRDAPEWNTDALGGEKRQKAMILLKRLRDQFGPQGLLHFGQGKWYPGEQLPRWAFGCYWRRDGEPIWQDPELVADEAVPYGFASQQAQQFVQRLAENLGVDARYAIPGYEDVWYYMWKERRLPTNVDPLKSKLADPMERERLAKIFEQQLGSVVGYALPLRRSYAAGPSWESGPWFLRPEHMYLLPGDSPMGYRLPLDSLGWEAPHQRQFMDERDPAAYRGELPRFEPKMQYRSTNKQSAVPLREGHSEPSLNGHARSQSPTAIYDPSLVRTALCVEARNGKLYVFMPPMRFLEDYLDLVYTIETTAAELDTPLLLEGYKPPSDHRLNHFTISPDPGVIEVNVQPAASWEEAVHITQTVYEEARLTRLCTEKFMLDGRHTGTGGGNHIVIGGESLVDSPLLRRPDLLRSLVGFWLNHPSLSYLFSGLFIGPTSQHPRVDEARHDALFELELAFKQIDPKNPTPPAWLVDRLFRNLLIDATGNTHRAEFCIDKLYNPDSMEGRRGLLELRSFEMPPHAEMSCVQQLLLRSMISWFWREPYTQPLVRWGTQLHDKFMLPHFVQQDLEDVLDELSRSGYRFDMGWFAPHLEFRFPFVGNVVQRGVNMELRTAIEPWHVLGEEGAPGGTVRFVDSSVERLQIKVEGLTDPRHVITCNGRRVPLKPTGKQGEYVAGVRYRAWQPSSCLHPHIPVHAPLVFDLLDTWNQRSLGGATYFVAHPGGRSFDTFPINAREAEGRRAARYWPLGHSQGPISVPPAEETAEFPYTLDLRQPEPLRPIVQNLGPIDRIQFAKEELASVK